MKFEVQISEFEVSNGIFNSISTLKLWLMRVRNDSTGSRKDTQNCKSALKSH